MSWLKKLFGGSQATPAVASPASSGDIQHPLPLGLRMGGIVQFDRTMYQVAPGAFAGELPPGHQPIECIGHINLGDGYAMHRFYVHDDAYIQVMTVGESVDSIMAFSFHDTLNPATKAEFQRFVSGHPHLGAQEIDYSGHRWTRVTSPEAGPKIPPMAYEEVLYRGSPPRRSDDLTHYACVYSRQVPELEREEFLLVTAEDSGPNEFLITYAVGLALTEADLDVT